MAVALLVLVTLAGAARPADAAPVGRLAQLAGERGCIHGSGINRCARRPGGDEPGGHRRQPRRPARLRRLLRQQRRGGLHPRPASGRLEQLPGRRGCVGHGAALCSTGRALARPVALAISPDGPNVYVAAAGSDALAVFARNRRTGTLRQLPGPAAASASAPAAAASSARALNEPTSVAVSPTARHVYVAGRRFPSAVAVLTRAADGASPRPSGTAGCVSARGTRRLRECAASRAPEEVGVSPDSRTCSWPASEATPWRLRRGPRRPVAGRGRGRLHRESAGEGCARGQALSGPVDLAITPDGRSVYVASSESRRRGDPAARRATGALTPAPQPSRAASARTEAAALRARDARSTRCGASALSAGRAATSTPSPRRSTCWAPWRATGSSGRLEQLPGRWACFMRAGGFGCPEGRGLTVAVAVTVSRDGRNVYVASEDAYLGSLAIFRRFVRMRPRSPWRSLLATLLPAADALGAGGPDPRPSARTWWS